MRKYVVTSIVLLPLLLSFSHAAQNWSVDPPEQPLVFSSEDSGTSSYLGVDISDVTTERLSALKLKEEKGVEVTMVDQDAPAGKAGIKEHDVILTMNGTAIESGAQLRRMIHETPPGRIVTLGLSRDGQPMTVKVQLADKHKEFSMMGPDMKNFHVQIPEIHIPDIDIPSINMVMVTSSARSGLIGGKYHSATRGVLRCKEWQRRPGALRRERQPCGKGWLPRRRRDREGQRPAGA